ncbi:type I DNA topoisomerase [Petrotoga sp. 9PWA.NaAc.5.4]|uniref:type I DNA topoisomerase n=1 Tax=Petrotoga sp. 9PWA.NaAc.5.4 TaxID=1434328 RepID=UPI000CB5A122|nr:type I DNA topoisomerase [Petrotoga sp. 9PWA.NaAc.5.4]PNR96301.1 DNA topoisomerase I [Petrotoga sp. 9PWA.NaAc.5.4]
MPRTTKKTDSQSKNGNKKYVVIVESPSKAKTIERYLGKDYKVIASKGHVRDLPEKDFGVDIENDFEPIFQIIPNKEKVINEIKKEIKGKKVLLASDMDREGEAIAWHISQLLNLDPKEKNRIIFSEITKNSILNSIKKPQTLDLKKVDAQIARRILDRIVGYKISPLVWKVLKNYRTSAGRVQSAALKLIIDQERKIFTFKPKKYFSIYLELNDLKIPLTKENGKTIKPQSINEKKKNEIFEYLKDKSFHVSNVEEKEASKNPPLPFITSTMQQTAVSMFNWSSTKVMKIAQELYEGVETSQGQAAFITYMRTDSTRISEEAKKAAIEYLQKNYGKEYVGNYTYKNKKSNVQDAHEAIRPTDVNINPQIAKKLISGDHLKLYTLIWNRFMASQSSPSKYLEKKYSIDDTTGKYTFEITSKKRIFDGFENFWNVGEKEAYFELNEKTEITSDQLKFEEKETNPPNRYTEASLIKELEAKGIGRPSTYATIISTLLERKYIVKISKSTLKPTTTGFVVTDFLEKFFPEIVDVKFTANMEEDLDKIEEGKNKSKQILETFYENFEKFLKKASESVKNKELLLKYESDVACQKCGKNMILNFGRYGLYLSCEECKETQKIPMNSFGITIKDKLYIKDYLKETVTNNTEDNKIGEKCPVCGGDLVLKHGKFGEFIACSNYPKCTYTKNVTARGKCPNCGGEIKKLKSKKGKTYFKCDSCGNMYWYEPSEQKCPECGETLFYRQNQGKEKLYCIKDKKYFEISK